MRPAHRAFVLVLALCAVTTSCGFRERITGPIPFDAEAQSSKIFASDGTLITTLHAEQNRETVPLARMALSLRDAVVAIEDRRFWQHNGVDIRAMLRAAVSNASEGTVVEGGSTITQQYIKNVLLGPQQTLHRKLNEASLAIQLERHSSKQQILEGYLNTIYFGNGAYGAQAAASVYFGTTADHLTLVQSALLAGLIQSPSAYDPYTDPRAATDRRNVVLEELVRQGKISGAEADSARREPLGVSAQPTMDRYPAAYFVESVKKFILSDPTFGDTPAKREAALFTGGLRIYTTVDLKLQAAAEDAVNKVLSKPDVDPSAAVVSIEPSSGAVRALVGGRDFFGTGPNDRFDLATQGARPAGSSFKPFVLAAALQAGIPLSKEYAAPSSITLPLPDGEPPWQVRNYEDESGGRMNLTEATVHSINTVYAQLVLEVGPDKAVGLARRMGIGSPLQPYPSAVLGTNDVTPLDMASAYCTFANRGIAVQPVFVTRVTKSDGTVIYEHQRSTVRALPTDVSDTVTGVLQQVVQRGTGVGANIGRPVAGKTGTGEQWRDAWFIGYTPELTTSVWVGFPQGEVSMVPPTTRITVTGGSWPASIWQRFMSAALAERPITEFAVPPVPSTPTTTAPPGSPLSLVAVPNLVGMAYADAVARLAEVGLTAVRKDISNRDYSPGFVVGQDPAPGAQAVVGASVVLRVSTGSVPTVTVPDVLGQTPAQARATLQAAGLVPRVVIEAEPPSPGSSSRSGKVWRQSPSAGTRVDAGAVVTLSVNPG